jgi:polo-like kinase 1
MIGKTPSPKEEPQAPQVLEEKIKVMNSEDKIRKYIKGKLLGRGGFAYCYEYKCVDNNKIFAIKVINKENIKLPRQRQKLMSEIKIHKSLHHSQVVAFEHNFEDDKNVYILLEICRHQTLNELYKRRKTLTEIEVQCYMIQLIKGLQYLHSHKIIHRDLKLGNLFLTDKMELKIGDFGLATKLDYDGEKKRTVCGTPNYIAPEVLEGEHSYEVDVWAIGIIIYTLLIGKPPFESRDINVTYKHIKEIDFKFPDNAKISYAAIKLIKRILVKNPEDRPSFDEILIDDFFNQGSAIPKLLPSASLATAPTLDYIKRFIPNLDLNGVSKLQEQEKIDEEIRKQKEKEKEKEKQAKEKENQAKEKEKQTKEKENKEGKSDEKNNKEKEKENTTAGEGSTKDISTVNENENKNMENNDKEKEKEKEKLKEVDIFVTKWVDYSSKYGIGYLLSNNLIGVYFNDCTKLIYNPRTAKLSFIERNATKDKDMMYNFGIKEAPKELQKKILIFQQFKKYFEEELNPEKTDKDKDKDAKSHHKSRKKKSDKNKEEEKKEKPEDKEQEGDNVFLRKWLRTNQAIIFRLSNKTIQVIFKDKTEIILFDDMVSYKDKKKYVKTYKVDDAINSSNFEMDKRIKYVQNIFTKIISIHNNNKI